MNTLQYTYLIPWWRHKCVTSHVTKVYFIELLLNIQYIEFWRKIFIKTCENAKDFLPEDSYNNFLQFFQKINKDEH